MTARKLSEIAKTVRSKNAGVDKITFDVIFAERADYDLVRRSGVLSRAAVCRLFGIPESRITDTSNSTRHWRSNSRSCARSPAAARATPTSSAVSNTAHCWTLQCHQSDRTHFL